MISEHYFFIFFWFLFTFHCPSIFSFLKFLFFSFFSEQSDPLLNSEPYSILYSTTQALAKTLCFLSLYCFTPITETTQNISKSCRSEGNLRVNRLSSFLLFVPLCCFFPFFFRLKRQLSGHQHSRRCHKSVSLLSFHFFFFLLSHIGHMKLQTLLWIWRWECCLLKYSS